jgi:hypothetical protein
VRVTSYLAHVGASNIDAVPGIAVPTSPGDVLAFDEHLYHASAGGAERRQWRMDFVRDAVDDAGESALRAFFARLFPAGSALPYDALHFPSYAPEWLVSTAPAAARLRALGVDALLRAYEKTY